jgi:hypothetical protein
MKNRFAKHLKLPALPSLKPRNPLIAAAGKRKAGAHKKSGKAERRAERVALQRLKPEQMKGE